jgi:hypothetical protein
MLWQRGDLIRERAGRDLVADDRLVGQDLPTGRLGDRTAAPAATATAAATSTSLGGPRLLLVIVDGAHAVVGGSDRPGPVEGCS